MITVMLLRGAVFSSSQFLETPVKSNLGPVTFIVYKNRFFFSLFLAISVGKGGHDVGRVRLHWRLPNSPPELLSACWRTRSFSGSKCHQVESKHKTHLSEQRFEKLEINWHFSPKLTQREEWRSLFTSSPQTRQEQRRNQAEHRVG